MVATLRFYFLSLVIFSNHNTKKNKKKLVITDVKGPIISFTKGKFPLLPTEKSKENNVENIVSL